MFLNAEQFNQDIGGWNVGNVTEMDYMFFGATQFRQNLCGWIPLLQNKTMRCRDMLVGTSCLYATSPSCPDAKNATNIVDPSSFCESC